MPRNGSGTYGLPAAYLATTGTTITATQHNVPLTDIEADLNAARPVGAGGTGASTAAQARTNLGLAIGSDVQAFDSLLASISGLTTSADLMIYTTASNTAATTPLTAFGRSLIDDSDAAAAQTTLGVPPNERTVSAAGLATGGGDLSANRTITVTAASQAEAEAGTATNVVMTPQRTKQAIDEQRGIYTGVVAAQTDFPIGTVLMVRNDAVSAPPRNGSVTVRLGTSIYVYTNAGSGAALAGTWRSRGTDEDNANATRFLVQRTA